MTLLSAHFRDSVNMSVARQTEIFTIPDSSIQCDSAFKLLSVKGLYFQVLIRFSDHIPLIISQQLQKLLKIGYIREMVIALAVSLQGNPKCQ